MSSSVEIKPVLLDERI